MPSEGLRFRDLREAVDRLLNEPGAAGQIFPVMSAEDVARIGYRKFMRGRKIIVTGWFNRLAVFARRFTPDFLLVPVMGWLFRVRDAEGNLQMPRALGARKAGNGSATKAVSSGDGPSAPA